jgi:hypothetical protein
MKARRISRQKPSSVSVASLPFCKRKLADFWLQIMPLDGRPAIGTASLHPPHSVGTVPPSCIFNPEPPTEAQFSCSAEVQF